MSTDYLVRTPSSYCFRLVVPPDLHTAVGRKELRYSLRTGRLCSAKPRARLLAGRVQHLFRALRNRDDDMGEHLSATKITEVIKGYVRECLNDDFEARIVSAPVEREGLAEDSSNLDFLLEAAKE